MDALPSSFSISTVLLSVHSCRSVGFPAALAVAHDQLARVPIGYFWLRYNQRKQVRERPWHGQWTRFMCDPKVACFSLSLTHFRDFESGQGWS